jgi:Spy/CpxP family protein refolding chaperone
MKRSFLHYAAVAMAAAGMTFAQTTPAPGNPAPGTGTGRRAFVQHRFQRMAQALNLTDAQKEQAKAAFQQARQDAQPIRAQLKQNRQSIADAVKAGKSEAEIRELAGTTGTLAGQLAAIRATTWAKVYATLTPDQRDKADQMREQMKNRFRQRSGGGQHSNG